MDNDLSGRAVLAVMQALRDCADYARGLVGAVNQAQPVRDKVRALKRLRLHALTALDRGVLACRVEGASWAELGDALGLPAGEVERRYSPVLDRWLGQAPVGDHVLLFGDHVIGLPYDVDPLGTARSIDNWYARHAEPWETTDTRPGPVERALTARA